MSLLHRVDYSVSFPVTTQVRSKVGAMGLFPLLLMLLVPLTRLELVLV